MITDAFGKITQWKSKIKLITTQSQPMKRSSFLERKTFFLFYIDASDLAVFQQEEALNQQRNLGPGRTAGRTAQRYIMAPRWAVSFSSAQLSSALIRTAMLLALIGLAVKPKTISVSFVALIDLFFSQTAISAENWQKLRCRDVSYTKIFRTRFGNNHADISLATDLMDF